MDNRFQILTLNKISSEGLKRFPSSLYTVGTDVLAPDGILVRSQLMHELPIAASVKAIGRAGAGTNNIPVPAMSARGIVVFNAAGANANAVKELVVAGMLMAARNLVPALHFTVGLDGDDSAISKQVESGKKNFVGTELRGRTLGVIGLGAIGRLVADTALALGMKVIGFDPEITVEAAWSLSSAVKKANTMEELLRHSDYVTLHVPLVDATRRMISAERLTAMKTGAVLLNFSREGTVDSAAVLESIQSRHLRYYVCDFPENRLKGHNKVVALPHLGASTEEAEENCAVMVVDQLREYLEHGNLSNSVNFPNLSMPRESQFRIALAHDNAPNMLGQISTALAHSGINIHNMINKSRGELAYTLVDNDSVVPAAAMQLLQAIPGVKMVRDLTLKTPC